ncbi:MAG: anthranilate phosphoribosyltransferase [Gemmataceae bacterium]|nr:anthranilate phosphoribosyltransferase [Gemmataceae bacterium]
MRDLLEAMIVGRCDETEAAALLVALRMKGETAAELGAAASALREHMVRLNTNGMDVLDTSGTGGDGSGTFNISTVAALVAAAAGVAVVKHGNRAVSSRSGSADVLADLGVAVEAGPAWSQRCLEQAGFAFCFAPHFHPALKHVAVLRRRLGVRTLFNSLGPLVNPASAPFHLMGVGRPELLDLMAGALTHIGCRHALLVWGCDGLDEVTLSGPTMVREVRGTTVTSHEWTPVDFGLEPCTLDDLRADGPTASAMRIHAILEGESGPAQRIVLANAAAALLAAERVRTLREGVELARQAIESGRARQVLERLRACTPDT